MDDAALQMLHGRKRYGGCNFADPDGNFRHSGEGGPDQGCRDKQTRSKDHRAFESVDTQFLQCQDMTVGARPAARLRERRYRRMPVGG
ncbi:MAG TPA: hypothetical protein VEY69_05520 [Lautropia sp.]|nr:hypothetical protein [Lautropia sp.]